MGKETAISWADSTANLWVGCQKVSAACDHCYAEDLMGTEGSRFKRVEWGPHGVRQRVKQGWADCRKWQRAAAGNGGLDPELGRVRRVFVNSLSDFFDNHESVVWRDEAWDLIRACPDLIFMLVTKRPQLIGRFLPPFWDEIAGRVWLLTTVENQEEADRRVPALLGSVRGKARPGLFGLSVEPMLGPVDLDTIWLRRQGERGTPLSDWLGDYIRPLVGNFTNSPRIGWVIVGGESGPHARPMNPLWAEALRDQCEAAGVPFHFKQWGEWVDASWLGDGSRLWTTMSSEVHNDAAVETVAWPDGSFSFGVADDHGGRGLRMLRLGKRAANNHLLAGRVHDAVPANLERAA